MALKKRTFIDKCEVFHNGAIQVREKTEIYDTTITPVDAIEEVRDDEGVVTESYIPAIIDVQSSTYHRYIIKKDDPTPSEIQIFLDNSKAG